MFRAGITTVAAMFLIAASPIHQTVASPTPPAKNEASTDHHNAQDANRGTEHAPLIVKIEHNPLTKADAAQEQTDRDEKISTDNWIIGLTLALAFIGIIQTVVFGIQSWLLKKTIDETRRIGEAQVQTYVGIPTAALDFLDIFLPGEALPRLTIVAVNSGKSTARNFIWRPTLEWIGGNQRRARDLGGNWIGAPGATIPIGGTFQESVLIPDMLLVRFASTIKPPPDHILMRVRIEFSFTNAFNKRIDDQIFFVGLAVPSNDPDHPNMWRISITPESHLRGWGQVGPLENQ